MAKKRKKASDIRTRKAILNYLKQNGPVEAKVLGEEFGLTDMAVRLHLYDLQEEKLVTHFTEPRPLGRPAKMWQLTSQADQFFPNGHADLVVNLIKAMGDTFGPNGMEKLLKKRAKQQVAEYNSLVRKKSGLKKHLQALAKIRTKEGYMAESISQNDGSFLFVENHCPICTAASSCQGLCSMEQDVFQQVLGDQVSIERIEHIQEGARRCAYRIAQKKI